MADKIIVIDGDNQERCDAMIAAFRPFAEVYRYNCEKERVETELPDEPDAWDSIDHQGMHFLLGLIHGGDKEHALHLDIQSQVFYGGIEGHDARAPDGQHQIHRSILSAEDTLKESEAKALFRMAKFQENPPAFLFNPSYNSDTDPLIDIFHDELLAPQFVEDWPTLREKHRPKFRNFIADWERFTEKVIVLDKQEGPLTPKNESYNQLVNELIDKIFQ